eukprot:12423735-Karenia_brevis.AAC.1
MEVLQACFPKDMYHIDTNILAPTQLGWPSRRPRRWSIVVHRKFLASTTSSLNNVIPLFQRVMACTWRCYLIASAAEVRAQLAWAMNRPKSHAHGQPVPEAPAKQDFLNALIPAEKESLDGYLKDSEP